MEALWTRSPLSAEDVHGQVSHDHEWQEATVKTLLGRLFAKGAVSVEKDGRRYLYSASIARDAWLLSESKGFLDRRFGGRIAPLVAHFSAHRKLTRRDLAELRQLIKEIDDGR